MRISVIIPSYNDAAVLQKCLERLSKQETTESFEVIVVDDGSTDNTQELLADWQSKKNIFELVSVFQENKKQGAARNAGIKRASGEIVIFIGADILVQKHWLEEHKKFHDFYKAEEAIGLGFMTWSPEFAYDRFRKWLEDSKIMLSYAGLINYQKTDFWHFYTGNISMKKSWFEKYWFDEDFTAYGWEDIMLGYQMLRDGGVLYFVENAKAWHHHELKESDLFPDRMREIGKSAVLFHQKFPEVPVIPTGKKLFIFQVISLTPVIFLLSLFKKEWAWYAKSKRYFLEGVTLKLGELS